jgi:simple sugar transport system substrate-binding protein/basic membrane protein A
MDHLHRSIAAAAFVTLTAFAAAAEEPKAAILLPGSANDQSWNALGYSILKSLESHGFKTAYSENVADADEGEALRDYAAMATSSSWAIPGASSRRWSR